MSKVPKGTWVQTQDGGEDYILPAPVWWAIWCEFDPYGESGPQWALGSPDLPPDTHGHRVAQFQADRWSTATAVFEDVQDWAHEGWREWKDGEIRAARDFRRVMRICAQELKKHPGIWRANDASIAEALAHTAERGFGSYVEHILKKWG